MPGNTDPIFSRAGDIDPIPCVLLTAAADYTGLSAFNAQVYKADATNGSFIQRLRFKALGTNTTSVARIYLNPGTAGHLASLLAAPGTPTGTPSTTGGTMLSGTSVFVARIAALDANGCLSALSAESATVSTTGPTASIAWAWTASTGASSYRIYTGQAGAASEAGYWTSATNSFTQIAMQEGTGWNDSNGVVLTTLTNNLFYGELSLPATTAIATAATSDIDYPMNFALPPGWEVYVGLGTTVAAGWQVVPICGKY